MLFHLFYNIFVGNDFNIEEEHTTLLRFSFLYPWKFIYATFSWIFCVHFSGFVFDIIWENKIACAKVIYIRFFVIRIDRETEFERKKNLTFKKPFSLNWHNMLSSSARSIFQWRCVRSSSRIVDNFSPSFHSHDKSSSFFSLSPPPGCCNQGYMDSKILFTRVYLWQICTINLKN